MGESGVGTVEWTALQQSRFDNDRYPLSIQLIQYMESANLIEKSISKKINNLSISNLERLLGDPDVRNVFSITREKNELKFPAPNQNLKKILNHLLTELLSESFTVNKIRNKTDRTEFIKYFIKKYGLTEKDIDDLKKSELTTVRDYDATRDKTEKTEDKGEPKEDTKSIVGDTETSKTVSINKSKVHEMPSTKERSTLIPKDFNLTIKNTKINDIYKELKVISVNDYPNVVGASFRVFLELSIDYYINKYKDEINLGKQDHLNNKLEKVKTHIIKKLNLDKNELKDINRAISSNNNIVSVDVLHGYIHSTVAQASADGLKTTWNNYERFFELLYKVLNDLSMTNTWL